MYYNEEHKRRVIERGDGYTYIGSYRCNEITIDGKNKSKNSYIRVKCPYCGKEYDIDIYSFVKGNKSKCNYCCNFYEKSFAYHIQQELKEPLNKYWDWEKNNELGINPYYIKPQSGKKVYIKCGKTDYHESYLVSPAKFYNGRRCPYCTGKSGKIHPKDSFGQWLIDTYGEDAIEKYWSSKNTINPFEVAPKSGKKVWILCQEHEYHNDNGGYEISCNDFYNGNRCSYCVSKKIHLKDSFGQWLVDIYGEDAIEKYWSSKNTLDPFKIAPKSDKKIWLLCQEKDYHNDDGGYEISCNNFYNGNRCSYCGNHKVHPKDSFGSLYPEKAKYWSKNNKKLPYEVTPHTSKKYRFICERCGKEFERSLEILNRANTGVFCRECNSSQLEIKTKYILEKYNINYNIQVEYNGLIGLGNGNLSYDFYLPDYNLLIECQGEQHERFVKGFHETKKDFEKQLEHDKRKKQYAKEHNINLLEIWYYDIDDIENILINKLNLK